MVSAFADGGLEATEAAGLQTHLRTCASCRDFLANISRVRDLLRAQESRQALTAVGPDFAAGVARRLAGERVFVKHAGPPSAASRALGFWGRLSGAAAAAVLLLSVAWSWNQISTSEEVFPTAVNVPASQESEEGSVASYLREHAFETMDATFLGSPEGVELASFEVSGQGFE